MTKNLIIKITLVIVFIASLFIRLYHLELSPQHLNWDETALGYNAYSLLTTARDEYGRFMPLTLRSFNDYKGAIYTYIIAVFIPIFGLNEFTIRLPSAISGSLLVIVAFLWGKKLFSSVVGLFMAISIGLSPYWLLTSRTAFESNLALLLLASGWYLIINKKFQLPAIFILILSAYIYHSSKLIVPFILFYYLIWKFKNNLKKQLLPLTVAFLLGLPLIYLVVFDSGAARLSSTSITSLSPFIPTGIPQWTILSPYYFINEILGRIIAVFSPSLLFAIGSHLPGQRLPTSGIYQLWMVFPWFLGLIYIYQKRQCNLLLVHFLLLLPAGLTWDWFNPIRLLPALAFHSLYIGLGLNYALELIQSLSTKLSLQPKDWNFKSRRPELISESTKILNYVFLLTITLLTISGTIHASSIVLSELGGIYRGDYQYSMKQLIQAIQPYQSTASQVVIDVPHAQPYIFWLLFAQIDPTLYQQYSSKAGFNPTQKNLSIDKYHFRQVDWPIDGTQPNTLILTNLINVSDEKIQSNPQAQLIEIVKDPRGNELGRIIKIY